MGLAQQDKVIVAVKVYFDLHFQMTSGAFWSLTSNVTLIAHNSRWLIDRSFYH